MGRLSRFFYDHVGQTSDAPMGLEIEKAEGIFLYATDGKRYVDMVSGVSVSNVGHGNQEIIDAVCKQVQTYMHLMVYGEFIQSPQVEFAKLLTDKLPSQLNCVYFVNSGSEAVEGALKLAKRHTGRTEIVSFKNAYHGSTHGALSVMGNEFFRNSYRPLLPDIKQINFNSFDEIEQITERTAAVIIEPFQGEAGFIAPQKGFLNALRERCTEMGTLLLFDEIQTGFGRSGELFVCQKYGVTPDILIVAKAMGGGMPLGGFISSQEIMSAFKTNPVLGHITTFGGHPVCCAAAKAALEYIYNNELIGQIESKSELFEELLSNIDGIKEIRREGLLISLDFGTPERCMEVIGKCFENGLITETFLFNEVSIRIAPPLTTTEEEIRYICDQLRKSII